MNVYLSSDAEQDLVDGYWFYEYQEQGAGGHFKSCLLNDGRGMLGTHKTGIRSDPDFPGLLVAPIAPYSPALLHSRIPRSD